MHPLLAAGAVFALVLLSSCAPRRPEPVSAPPPPPVSTQPPQPAPPPLAWQDAPLSPGDWSWREGAGVSAAAFGSASAPVFVVRCAAGRQVELVRTGASGTTMTIRTTGTERRIAASAGADGVVARFGASDALLDEIAFSRGRFAVEANGGTLLILPAWPEPARVIEDCRG